MILQPSPAPQSVHPTPTRPASPRPGSAASVRAGAPAGASGDPPRAAAADPPIIDRLIPAWQPARGVSQAAITLAAVLIIMLLIGGIASLGRRAVFFFRTGEWKQPPPRVRAWKLGPEGMSYEMGQDANLENEQLRILLERVDAAVSNVQIITDRLPGLTLPSANRSTGLQPSNEGVENAHL